MLWEPRKKRSPLGWVNSGHKGKEGNGDGPLEKVWHEGKRQEEAGAVQRNC